MNTKYSGVRIKHAMTDAKDCEIRWNADFAKMTLTIRADFISPMLLLTFLYGLEHDEEDERFAKTKIVGAIEITSRFTVRLELPSGTAFRLRAYQPFSISETRNEPLELEIFELPRDE